tara:strand:- start:605 stop:781 length:177 start_codon:yes stop_codon:yes gene_type:complete
MAKVKTVNVDSLNTRQITALKKHAKHHTVKHVKHMVGLMNKGKTFTESHKTAMKKVGK